MNDVQCLTISDVHLGHDRNPTKDIIKNLDTFFGNYLPSSEFINLDIIFIAGDLYDQLLDNSSDDGREIKLWLGRLMNFCSRFDIKLRILRGTPSHDWRQPKVSETVYKLIDKPFDFRYIETLHIEYLSDLDMHILYVPDEWTPKTEDTLRQVHELLEQNNLKQVDVAIMHGSFGYQLPAAAKNIPKHDETAYLDIVKHYICIGHVHVHTVYERILAQGSFDRISHGEESPKGAVLFSISKTRGNSFYFIENKFAKKFVTITLRNKDLEKSLMQVEKLVATLPNDSFIRIKAEKDHPLYVASDKLKVLFPMITFSKKSIDEEEDDVVIASKEIILGDNYKPITITRDNIVSLIMSEVGTKYNLTQERTKALESLLIANNG